MFDTRRNEQEGAAAMTGRGGAGHASSNHTQLKLKHKQQRTN